MIDVSVIMPVYNTNHKLLHRAIKSILSQTLKNIQLILIDDGSSNGSEKICDDYAELDTRVQVIHQENSGICAARNNAIKIARGEYIGFCDHDDCYSTSQLLENYHLAKCNDADIVKFGYRYICLDDGIKFPFDNYKDNICIISNNEIYNEYKSLKNCGVLNFVWDGLFKRKYILEHGLFFNEQFKIGQEDIDYCNRYIEFANKLIYNPKKYYCHYRYQESTSRGMDKKKMLQFNRDEMIVFQQEIEIYLKHRNDSDTINSILTRNLMILISSLMRSDTSLSFREKELILINTRKCKYWDELYDLNSIDDFKMRMCAKLYMNGFFKTVLIMSKLYVLKLKLL